jgi:dihydroorotate dehydrogenase
VGVTPIEFCGLELAHPVINGSGTFDALAARRVFGDALLEQFPFSAYVSKTITLDPRPGNPPPRLWETPAGMINSDCRTRASRRTSPRTFRSSPSSRCRSSRT